MEKAWNRVKEFFLGDLWAMDTSSFGGIAAFCVFAVRLVVVIARDVLYGKITLQAMSLVYTTLLSLVPLLAFSFSVLKAFGVHNQLEGFLSNLLAPLGPGAADITHRIVDFVNNMKVGVLGFVGVVLLIYTVISLIEKIEESLNAIWRVRNPRSFLQQFSEYLSVLLVGPLLVVVAIGLTAAFLSTAFMQKIASVSFIGAVIDLAGMLIPYVLICAAFSFIYVFVPNTRVRAGSALVGGVIAGALWQSIGWGFASFIVTSAKYAAIYSGFAVLIFFILWIYLSWLILLIGAEISYYYQNPQFMSLREEGCLQNPRLVEHAAVSIMYLIGRNFYYAGPPWNVNALVQRLGVDVEQVENILEAMKKGQLIVETAGDLTAYLPARDIEAISIKDVYDAVRGRERALGPVRRNIPPIEEVETLVNEVDEAIGEKLARRTIKDVVVSAMQARGKATDDHFFNGG